MMGTEFHIVDIHSYSKAREEARMILVVKETPIQNIKFSLIAIGMCVP